MSIYLNKKNIKYVLEDTPLSKGGEGEIYNITNFSAYVAKIFYPAKRTSFQHKKLELMTEATIGEDTKKQVTWPIEVLYDHGKFVGYVMPKVRSGEELGILNLPKYKNVGWSKRICIAINLCAAIDSVHKLGHICGDLNPKNIFFDIKNYNVTLLDTDSYHIIDSKNNKEYRCSVGMGEYLPRELLDKCSNGMGLDSIPLPSFTRHTDYFALAVHIFTLMMGGYHPFSCRIIDHATESTVFPRKQENIQKGFSPYLSKQKFLDIPIGAPTIDILPKEIQDMFYAAFVRGHSNPTMRPTAFEWYEKLDSMRRHIQRCSNNQNHEYFNELDNCPWCKAEIQLKKVKTVSASPKTTNISPVQYKIPPSPIKPPANSNPIPKSRKKPSWGKIIASVIIIIICLVGVKTLLIDNNQNSASPAAVNVTETKKSKETKAIDNSSVFNKKGVIFADSNKRYLTRKEIENLASYDEYKYEELLRFAINEIYARLGHKFKKSGAFWSYYSQFDWYNKKEKKTVVYDMFNKFEQKNIDLLIEISEENQFR